MRHMQSLSFHPYELSFLLSSSSWRGGKKEARPESRQTLEVAAAQTSGLVNLVFSCQTGFFECEHPFNDKEMVITLPSP